MAAIWCITRDFTADENARPGTNMNAVGICSRRSIQVSDPRLVHRFRMYDDDRNLYYEGLASDEDFAPLDEFGTPNAGCTEIRYLNERNEWVTL